MSKGNNRSWKDDLLEIEDDRGEKIYNKKKAKPEKKPYHIPQYQCSCGTWLGEANYNKGSKNYYCYWCYKDLSELDLLNILSDRNKGNDDE